MEEGEEVGAPETLAGLVLGEELTPAEYEELTRQFMAALGHMEGVETVRIERDVDLEGWVMPKHQIDVVWDFIPAGESEVRRAVFECRRYKRAVENKDAWAYAGVVGDLVEPASGVMVTRTGFQKGAREVAEGLGLAIWTLRKPTAKDWKGRVETIHLSMSLELPVLVDLAPRLEKHRDGVPAAEEGAGYDEAGEVMRFDGHCEVRFPDGRSSTLIEELQDWWQDAPLLVDGAEPAAREVVWPKGTELVSEDGVSLAMAGMSGRVGRSLVPVEPIVIDGKQLVAYVAQDLLEKRRFTVGYSGQVREVDQPESPPT